MLLSLLVGCEDERPSPAPPAPPATPTPPARPAAEEPPPSPWPTEVRPLAASVADFESFDGCVASMRESVPVEVAELFYDLGYDDALGEICRSLQAAATGDPAHCDALVSSTVQRRCRTRLAALHEKPEACPEALGRDPGRDPTCLAWATRDASLCDGATSADRDTCLAVATDDPERCEDPLGLRAEASCRALVARLEGVVNAEPPPERPTAELAIDEADPTLRLPTDAARLVERGVVATVDGCVHRVEVKTSPGLGDRSDPVGLTLELRLAGDGATLGPHSEVAIGPVGTSYLLTGTVELDEGSPRLGGPLVATFEAIYLRDGSERTIAGHLRTFFRDLPPLPSACRPE